jgi:cytochrome P450
MTDTMQDAVAAEPPTSEEADGLLAQLLLSPEGYADPYTLHRQIREIAPVYKSGMGYWIVTRHEDVNAVLRSPKVGRFVHQFMEGKYDGEWDDHAALRRLSSSLLWSNGKDHTRLRKLVNHAFTPRRVQEMTPVIEQLVDEMLDPLAEAGGGDIFNDFAFPLPITVVAMLLGVPREEVQLLRGPIQTFLSTFELGMTPDDLLEADKAMEFTEAYFNELIAKRRAEPQDDLLSALLEAEEEGGKLSSDELMTFCNTMIAAGFESTTALIGTLIWQLWGHPDRLRQISENRELVPAAVEEVLRYDPPVHLVPRMTAEPLTLGEVTIPAGETVVVLLASANRDPARFPDADVLDITREDKSHISFSAGPHHCIGLALARLEVIIVVQKLLDRFAEIELLETPSYRPRMTIRGMHSLNVKLVSR